MHERLIAYLDPSDKSVLRVEELEVELEVRRRPPLPFLLLLTLSSITDHLPERPQPHARLCALLPPAIRLNSSHALLRRRCRFSRTFSLTFAVVVLVFCLLLSCLSRCAIDVSDCLAAFAGEEGERESLSFFIGFRGKVDEEVVFFASPLPLHPFVQHSFYAASTAITAHDHSTQPAPPLVSLLFLRSSALSSDHSK